MNDAKVSMGPYSRRHWHKSRSGTTRLIGGKNGSKRHLLVDGRGVPLSFIVTGANRHDVTQLDAVLSSVMIKREAPVERRSKHLCLDAGYRGQPALEIIERHGYIPHVASRTQEKKAKQRHPEKKARRWIVEVCHSWFNRFRKLLVRYEKLEREDAALNHLAAAIADAYRRGLTNALGIIVSAQDQIGTPVRLGQLRQILRSQHAHQHQLR